MRVELGARMNRVIPAVNRAAMAEARISRGIAAEYLHGQTGSRLEQRARGQNLNLHRYDFFGRQRLMVTMRVPRSSETCMVRKTRYAALMYS